MYWCLLFQTYYSRGKISSILVFYSQKYEMEGEYMRVNAYWQNFCLCVNYPCYGNMFSSNLASTQQISSIQPTCTIQQWLNSSWIILLAEGHKAVCIGRRMRTVWSKMDLIGCWMALRFKWTAEWSDEACRQLGMLVAYTSARICTNTDFRAKPDGLSELGRITLFQIGINSHRPWLNVRSSGWNDGRGKIQQDV